MAHVAYIVAGLAVAGAVASWIAGAVFYVRTLAARSRQRPAAEGIDGARHLRLAVRASAVCKARPPLTPSSVNKALVAFFVCLIVAIAAISVATNLARISR